MMILTITNISRSIFLIIWMTVVLYIPRSAAMASDSSELLIGIVEQHPFVTKIGENRYTGLSVELWNEIARALDIKHRFIRFHDEVSILKSLEYGELDLTINPFHVTPARLHKFELTQPFLLSGVGVAVPNINRSQFRIFLANFFSIEFLKVILLLIFIIMIFGITLWLAERKRNHFQFRPGWLGVLDGLWWSAVTMTTVGYGDKAPKTLWGRAIAIIWMFTAVVIISSFTGTIASTLTVSHFESQLQSRQDLKFVDRLGTVGASISEDFLVSNEIFPTHTYADPAQGLRALGKKEINALVYDKRILNYLIKLYDLQDEVRILPTTLEEQYRSFILASGHHQYKSINAELVSQIQKPSWQQALEEHLLGEVN